MGRQIQLPILAAPNRSRVLHDMWGAPIEGIKGRVCDGKGEFVTYDFDSLCECLERHGAKVLAADPCFATDDIQWWVEWEDGATRELPPSFKHNPNWRDLI